MYGNWLQMSSSLTVDVLAFQWQASSINWLSKTIFLSFLICCVTSWSRWMTSSLGCDLFLYFKGLICPQWKKFVGDILNYLSSYAQIRKLILVEHFAQHTIYVLTIIIYLFTCKIDKNLFHFELFKISYPDICILNCLTSY